MSTGTHAHLLDPDTDRVPDGVREGDRFAVLDSAGVGDTLRDGTLAVGDGLPVADSVCDAEAEAVQVGVRVAVIDTERVPEADPLPVLDGDSDGAAVREMVPEQGVANSPPNKHI
jgi:hypothetical protein